MRHFSHEGLCLFGKHKGTHASRLPKLWVAWANQNVDGFKNAMATAIKAKPPPPPQTRNPTGRHYVLRKWNQS